MTCWLMGGSCRERWATHTSNREWLSAGRASKGSPTTLMKQMAQAAIGEAQIGANFVEVTSPGTFVATTAEIPQYFEIGVVLDSSAGAHVARGGIVLATA